jgi:conjugative relaxase-like TrwC/TraI family protein
MLSIGKLGAGQERYYTQKVAEGAEDYYSGEGEAQGYWLGDAARELGLSGKVSADQLTAMLSGLHPASGEPLGLRRPPGRAAVPGFDLTFSAPKSASLLWAFGGQPASAEVIAAHAASVKAALGYLERNACWTRRGHAGKEFVAGNGFTAAAYRHRSSRAGDPQLHTHVLIANATKGPDGRWSRLYHPAIYRHAKAAGYVYEAHLRNELTRRLGVQWKEVENGIAEIRWIYPSQLQAFSTRRQEILEATAADASMSARRIATLETRKAKDRGLSDQILRERWEAKAAEVDLTPEGIGHALGRERQVPEGTVRIADIESCLTDHASTFERREVIQAVAQSLPAGAPGAEVEELADRFLALDEVICLGAGPRGERFTTERIWEIEQGALAAATAMSGQGGVAVVGEVIAARVIEQRPSLKADQRAMVERLLGGGEGLSIVVGEAGAGKTYALVAAAEGWAQAEIPLRVAAPTWRAANVLRSEGLDATSVARLLAELDRGTEGGGQALRPGSVLLVDEAGMVGSADLARLIAHAEEAGAKLVLVGDPAQLGEIDAGGLFGGLVERAEPIVLDEVIRHRHDLDREAAKRIRMGEGGEAIGALRAGGRVFVAADPAERRVQMANDWWQSYRSGSDALMIAKRNSEVARLNALARELMRSEGRLGQAEIEVGGARFAAGDQVITRVNDQRAQIYNRERWRVAEVDAEARSAVLDGIDTARRVCVDAVYLERVGRDGAPALQHGYAATTYQAQGATVDRAYVMADPSMDRQEYYVAASRSREETYLYATPEVMGEREDYAPQDLYLRQELQHIAEAAERDGAQIAAHDAALRSSLAKLPSTELAARRDALRPGADRARSLEERRARLREAIARREAQLAEARAQIASLPAPGRRSSDRERLDYQRELGRLAAVEAHSEQAIASERRELRELPAAPARVPERIETAAIDYILAERSRQELAAVRISPPDYLVAEIGERPAEPGKAQVWDRGASAIQGYRRDYGVGDEHSALGPQRTDSPGRAAQERAQRSVERSRQQLGMGLRQERALTLARGMGR